MANYMVMVALFLFVLCALLVPAISNYNCLCNYAPEIAIFAQPSSTSKLLGYMYEYDCNEIVVTSLDNNNWHTIAVDHQPGYVKDGPQVASQDCDGNPPLRDVLTKPVTQLVAEKTTSSTILSSTRTSKTTEPPLQSVVPTEISSPATELSFNTSTVVSLSPSVQQSTHFSRTGNTFSSINNTTVTNTWANYSSNTNIGIPVTSHFPTTARHSTLTTISNTPPTGISPGTGVPVGSSEISYLSTETTKSLQTNHSPQSPSISGSTTIIPTVSSTNNHTNASGITTHSNLTNAFTISAVSQTATFNSTQIDNISTFSYPLSTHSTRHISGTGTTFPAASSTNYHTNSSGNATDSNLTKVFTISAASQAANFNSTHINNKSTFSQQLSTYPTKHISDISHNIGNYTDSSYSSYKTTGKLLPSVQTTSSVGSIATGYSTSSIYPFTTERTSGFDGNYTDSAQTNLTSSSHLTSTAVTPNNSNQISYQFTMSHMTPNSSEHFNTIVHLKSTDSSVHASPTVSNTNSSFSVLSSPSSFQTNTSRTTHILLGNQSTTFISNNSVTKYPFQNTGSYTNAPPSGTSSRNVSGIDNINSNPTGKSSFTVTSKSTLNVTFPTYALFPNASESTKHVQTKTSSPYTSSGSTISSSSGNTLSQLSVGSYTPLKNSTLPMLHQNSSFIAQYTSTSPITTTTDNTTTLTSTPLPAANKYTTITEPITTAVHNSSITVTGHTFNSLSSEINNPKTETRTPTTTEQTTITMTDSTTIPITTTTESTTTTTESTTTTPTTTTTTLPTTTRKIIAGNISMCPAVLYKYTQEDIGALNQYDDRCLELVTRRIIWTKAESDCQAKGGHLMHIGSQRQQEFVYKWLKTFNFNDPVWIGLSNLADLRDFRWMSGNPLYYTNWYAAAYTGSIEKCVVMTPRSPENGAWRKVHCGYTTPTGDFGQEHSFICEYPITGIVVSKPSSLVG